MLYSVSEFGSLCFTKAKVILFPLVIRAEYVKKKIPKNILAILWNLLCVIENLCYG
jgi:hypothetical protein